MKMTDWRMKAMADFFGVEFVRVDEDGEPMTTNDATRTALRSEDGMWERFDEEERIKQEMTAMGKVNDATPREVDRAALPPSAPDVEALDAIEWDEMHVANDMGYFQLELEGVQDDKGKRVIYAQGNTFAEAIADAVAKAKAKEQSDV